MPHQSPLPDALDAFGLRVVLDPGWDSRGSSSFWPQVVIAHHTASNAAGGNAPSLGICRSGRPDLPGPLCQVLLARDGTCIVVAAGRANHAGAGSWKGWAGNSYAWGIEAENNGVGEPWSSAQIDAYYRCAAALLTLTPHEDAAYVCGHKEWCSPPGRKIDPYPLDMGGFRSGVASALDGGAAGLPSLSDLYLLTQEDDPDDPEGPMTTIYHQKGNPRRAVALSEGAQGVFGRQVNDVRVHGTKRFGLLKVGGLPTVEVDKATMDSIVAQARGSNGLLRLDGSLDRAA